VSAASADGSEARHSSASSAARTGRKGLVRTGLGIFGYIFRGGVMFFGRENGIAGERRAVPYMNPGDAQMSAPSFSAKVIKRVLE
jgi:hypothetical protein